MSTFVRDDRAAGSGPRVLIVDAERVLAESLAVVLAGGASAVSPKTATGASEALHTLEQHCIDVMLIGIEPGDGQEGFLVQMARRHPHLRIVAMSAADGMDELVVLIRFGAHGWVPKSAQVDDVRRAIAGVAAGELWLPRAALEKAYRQLSAEMGLEFASRLSALTERERQVLEALAEGLPRREIAIRLRMSINTVRTHIQHVLVKLKVHTTLEAVALALQDELGTVSSS